MAFLSSDICWNNNKYSILGGSSYQLNTQISFSSVDYTVDEDNITGIQETIAEVTVTSVTTWSAPPPSNAPEWSAPEEPPAWPTSSEETTTGATTEQWSANFPFPPAPESTTSIEQEFGEFCIYITELEHCSF